MKRIIPFLLVGIPLLISAIFITNTIESQTFPLLRDDIVAGEENIDQTYKAASEYCKKSFEVASISENSMLKECIDSVERWYAENQR